MLYLRVRPTLRVYLRVRSTLKFGEILRKPSFWFPFCDVKNHRKELLEATCSRSWAVPGQHVLNWTCFWNNTHHYVDWPPNSIIEHIWINEAVAYHWYQQSHMSEQKYTSYNPSWSRSTSWASCAQQKCIDCIPVVTERQKSIIVELLQFILCPVPFQCAAVKKSLSQWGAQIAAQSPPMFSLLLIGRQKGSWTGSGARGSCA